MDLGPGHDGWQWIRWRRSCRSLAGMWRWWERASESSVGGEIRRDEDKVEREVNLIGSPLFYISMGKNQVMIAFGLLSL